MRVDGALGESEAQPWHQDIFELFPDEDSVGFADFHGMVLASPESRQGRVSSGHDFSRAHKCFVFEKVSYLSFRAQRGPLPLRAVFARRICFSFSLMKFAAASPCSGAACCAFRMLSAGQPLAQHLLCLPPGHRSARAYSRRPARRGTKVRCNCFVFVVLAKRNET